MIALQDEKGLLFRPAFEIAVLVEDGHGRWRVTLKDGGVAHLPGPRPAGPWVALGTAWVLPQLLRREGDLWIDPAGFAYAYEPLQAVEEPAAGPWLDGLPCHPDQVIRLCSQGTGSVWHTALGDFACAETAAQASQAHPSLLLAVRGDYYNPLWLRRIERDETRHRLVMADGSSLLVSHKFHFKAAQRLGLPHFFHLEPFEVGLWRDDKREYPYDLITASADRLRADFQSARQLISCILWQILRNRELGIPQYAFKDYRRLWYSAVKATLYRAGFLSRAELERDLDDRSGPPDLFLLLQTVMAQMVGEDRLFTFAEFGFVDKGAAERQLGDRLPQVVVVCEKDSLTDIMEELAAQFGVSYIVLGGQPSLIGSEFFAEMIRHVGPIYIVAYVDYDPSGWIIVRSFIEQLRRYGIDCRGGVRGYLVRAEYFSDQELELYALPLTPESAASAGKLRLWMAECQGVRGQEKGIHANHLAPVERVAAVLESILAGLSLG